jgi:ribosomal-protein-alanine N-acetyltransferase
VEIMNIVVKKSKRRMGIGKILLEKLIEMASKTNLKILTLEVNACNTPAIKLYEKFNFKRVGIRKKYYNNLDDAIIMNFEIN